MKKILLFFLVMAFQFSCHEKSNSEYANITPNIKFKYLQFGEGEAIQEKDFLALKLMVRDFQGDTLHYVPNYPYVFQLKQSELDSAWLRMKEGDSAEFILTRADFNKRFSFYKPMQSDSGTLRLNFRINKFLNKSEATIFQQKLLSKREIDEQAALRKFTKNLQGYVDTLAEVFRNVYQINHNGESIKNGSEVAIEYKGSFLNGYVFEDSREKGITPTFVIGQEFQLIEGMQIGLMGLKEGESVKIILPSRRAFGREGSLAGIVPPYTAVIFDVHIIKVKN